MQDSLVQKHHAFPRGMKRSDVLDQMAALEVEEDRSASRPCTSPARRQRRHRSSSSYQVSELLHVVTSPLASPTEIGNLSREEAEFDFALLLKASKSEENVNQPSGKPILGGGKTTVSFKEQNLQQMKDSILDKLHDVGLETKRLRSIDGKQTLIKVKAPQALLELGAEQLRLKKRRKVDLTWTTFHRDLRHVFAHYQPSSDSIHFLDSERQTIVYHLITAEQGAGLNDHSAFASAIAHKFPLHTSHLPHLQREWVTYWREADPRGSNSSSEEQLDSTKAWGWCSTTCRLFSDVLSQPLDDIAEYYGEHIAFYFAWLELYTRWLLAPSVMGLVLFMVQLGTKSLDQFLAPYYAVFMALWATFFLLAWKRHASVLAYRWGVLGFEAEEIQRPEFRGDDRMSTDVGIKRYPVWKRWLKYACTWTFVLACIATVVSVMYFAFVTKDNLEVEALNNVEMSLSTLDELWDNMSWTFWVFLLLTPMLYGLVIPLADLGFTKVARVLNRWENHKTESAYQSHLILKVFSFRFVHVFASLYYYAFAKGSNLLKVAIQLAAFMIAGQAWNNVMDVGFPFLRRKWIAYQRRRETKVQIEDSAMFQSQGHPKQQPPPQRRRKGRRQSGSNPRRRHSSSSGRVSHKKASPASSSPGKSHHHHHNIQEQCVRLEQATAKAWEEARWPTYDTFEDYTEMLIQFGYVSEYVNMWI